MITLDTITEAASRLKGHHVVTPLLEYEQLNQRLGGRILFKPENLQRTGSFKFRGAFNKIASLDESVRRRGVVTFSSGNHAQGVAAAAKAFGVPATIVMPEDAPALKRENTRALGGKVVLYDRHTGDRKAIAEQIERETGAVMVPPYDDEMIMAGQGTIGLEVAEQLSTLGVKADVLLCPVGGGGLIAGISTAIRALMPDTAVYCVEPEGFDDTRISLERGTRTANKPDARSICDAIVTQMPGEITFPVNLANLAGGLSVTDADVIAAVDVLFEATKLVVEPGGSVGFAALNSGRLTLDGRTAVVVLSGGNMDVAAFRNRFGTDSREKTA
ncbi:serine/threonine dehydratase [Azorhizobium oxalatiphilum]|uniref:Serine/threonine dehydratase n=1 Tax=Azorhizobium oxalatiphilum TaxID=980631 RepID=A0A917BNV0_9HYPH|nr:threonine/serine dehydratase [Azorhizobium oxalatiphilum]GGF50492.1 serine/threonine dehydratase [Azorhizobium oxalatiphilum]